MENNINEIDNSDEGISIKELINIVFKHIWIFVILVLIGGAAAFIYSRQVVVPKYSSNSSIYVADTNNIDLTGLQIANSLSDDYIAIMTTRPFMEYVRKDLNIVDKYTNEQIKSMISIVNKQGTHILTINVTTDDPYLSANISNSLSEAAVIMIPKIVKIEPPVIIETAIHNPNKVSPNVTLYTLIGLCAGLVIAVIITFLLEIIKSDFKTVDDVKNKLGLPVLGVITDYKDTPTKGE